MKSLTNLQMYLEYVDSNKKNERTEQRREEKQARKRETKKDKHFWHTTHVFTSWHTK